MPRTKGSKNRPKTNTTKDYASQIAEKQETIVSLNTEIASIAANIDTLKADLKEKKIIFSKYVLPKVLKRMSLKAEECVVTEDGLEAIVEKHKNTSGIRDLEQAAEHIAANALYQIEVDHLTGVTFNAEMVRELLS